MGQLTRTQIITAAMLQGGYRADLSSRMVIHFNAALRSLYKGWPWPFLKKRASGIALAAGTQALTLGAGSGGITLEIQEFFDPIYLYTSDRASIGKMYIQQLTGNANLDWDETLANSASWVGLPTRAKLRMSTVFWGRWDLIPMPFPDKAYLLAFDYLEQPADLAADATVPIYPSDRTLIKMVQAEAALDQHGVSSAQYQSAVEEAGALVTIDRQRYGQATGSNDNLGLDTSVFR